jgi:hypothetical protein
VKRIGRVEDIERGVAVTGVKIASSERHTAAHSPSPDVVIAADTAIFATSAERAVTEGHGHTSRYASGPSLQERHGCEADGRCIVS